MYRDEDVESKSRLVTKPRVKPTRIYSHFRLDGFYHIMHTTSSEGWVNALLPPVKLERNADKIM